MLCTACSKRKRREPATPIPASKRYLSPRIRRVLDEAERRGVRARILSGRYGLLSPDRRIPWYDQALRSEDVPAMAAQLERQLRRLRVEVIELWARPASTPGWRPYHDALRHACAAAGVRLRCVVLGSSWH
ncbi:MAG TPA: hypothetical protein VNB06_06645 [Thermoanaerobaculia bacterium]|nr:hypothetical protein [Thermoanaerobaculia bacterium]